MADEEILINGAAADDGDARAVEIDGVSKKDRDGGDSDRSEMIRKIEELEKEKSGLERENGAILERFGTLNVEAQELRIDKAELETRLSDMQKQVEESEIDRRATEAIAARAAQLEGEVSRLQHDLITSESAGEEANAKVSKLESDLEEKGKRLEALGAKMAGLQSELETKEAELESTVATLKNESNERAKAEAEAKAKIGEKESEIRELKKLIEELELLVAKNASELEAMIKEKKAEAGAKDAAAKAAEGENEKVGALESELSKLTVELEESKRVISELKEKALTGVNGITTTKRVLFFGSKEKGVDSLKLQWPAVAVATGSVVAVAVVGYLKCAKQR